MIAVAEIKGNQYLLKTGDILKVQKMSDHKEGDKVTIDNVLLTINGSNATIGTPYVKGALIELLIKKHIHDKKVRVYKMKAKKRFRRTQGHRQWYTQVEVLKIA